MRKMSSDLTSGIFLVLISLVIGLYMIPKSISSNPIAALSPALFPKLLTYLLTLLSITFLIQSYVKNKSFKQNQKNCAEIKNNNLKQVILLFIVLLAYYFLLKNIGYIISTPIFLFFLLLAFGEKNIIKSIIFSLSITFALYTIFSVLMKIKLP